MGAAGVTPAHKRAEVKRLTVWSIAVLVLALGSTGFAQKKGAAQPKFSNADCLACHSDPSMTKDENGKQVSLAVDEKKYGASIHGQMFQCVDCHTDIKDVPHSTTPAKPACAQGRRVTNGAGGPHCGR